MASSSCIPKRVIIVGAGLAGCLCGLMLARRGFTIQIYELRSDPRTRTTKEVDDARSVNLALSTRGLTALGVVGLAEKVVKNGVPMRGRCLHGIDGGIKTMMYGAKGEYLMSVSREVLNKLLVEACEDVEEIEMMFGWKCMGADVENVVVEFLREDGEKVCVEGDLIVGADGTWSKVRSGMARKGRFDFEQKYLGAAYKELSMPVSELVNEKSMPREYLHIWPRGKFMLIALPNPTGSFTCNLYMDSEGLCKLDESKEMTARFFEEQFKDAVELMPNFLHEFEKNPSPELVTIRCHPFHYGDSALLIGDAAHAIVPFYGQGCNAAFEDCRILDELFGLHGTTDIGKVLAEFTRLRKANVDTIADLAIENYHTMASKTASTMYAIKKNAGLMLSRLIPRMFVPLYTMVSFSNVPYREAVNRADKQEQWIDYTAKVGCALSLAIGLSYFVKNAVKSR